MKIPWNFIIKKKTEKSFKYKHELALKKSTYNFPRLQNRTDRKLVGQRDVTATSQRHFSGDATSQRHFSGDATSRWSGGIPMWRGIRTGRCLR